MINQEIKIIGKNQIGTYIAKNRMTQKCVTILINNGEVKIKSYNLLLQIFLVNGVNYGLSSDCNSVKEFKNYIDKICNENITDDLVSIEIIY